MSKLVFEKSLGAAEFYHYERFLYRYLYPVGTDIILHSDISLEFYLQVPVGTGTYLPGQIIWAKFFTTQLGTL